MNKSETSTAIQSETKPLLDYSSLYYASHRSASTSDHQKQQQQQQLQQLQQLPSDKRLTKSKRGLLLVVAGVATTLLLVAAIVVLAVAISKSVQHSSSSDNGNTPANIASMNTTLQTLQLGASRAQVQSGNSRQILGASRRKPVQTDTDDRDGRKAEADDTQSFADDDSYRTADTGAGQRSDQEELDESTREIYQQLIKQVNDGSVMNVNAGVSQNVESSSLVRSRSASDSKVFVKTNYGKVLGVEMKSRQGREYFGFFKIPYADPPVGGRRFSDPAPVRSWRGVLDASVYPPLCMQKLKYVETDEAIGDEDCLYLSIYTPKLPSTTARWKSLLPVMFYIHGGGFRDGFGFRYGADYFMDEDVVLVLAQYRMGPFGFLNSNDGDIRGNMGLKDNVMALKFVRDIIKYFGGDNKRITLFGNSAGGIAVSYHVLSPLTKGLFSGAIMQSGNSLRAFDLKLVDHPERTAKIIADRFNCSYNPDATSKRKQKLSECLRNVKAAEIAIVFTNQTNYGLTVELPAPDAFMPDSPLNLLRAGKAHRVPSIIGINSGEGMFFASLLWSPTLIELINRQWASIAPQLFQLNSSAFDPEALSYAVRKQYFQNKTVSNDTVLNLVELFGDSWMIHAAKVQATYQAAGSPVYLYHLNKKPAKSYGDRSISNLPPGNYGVSHADELQYLFPFLGFPEINTTSQYFKFSADLVKTWAEFAANGKPESAWLQFKPKRQELWYNLDDNRAMTDVLVDRMKFWDSYSAHDLSYE